MDLLTPLEQQALALYVGGTTSPTELGRVLGVSRQRGQQLIAALRTKVLVTTHPRRGLSQTWLIQWRVVTTLFHGKRDGPYRVVSYCAALTSCTTIVLTMQYPMNVQSCGHITLYYRDWAGRGRLIAAGFGQRSTPETPTGSGCGGYRRNTL